MMIATAGKIALLVICLVAASNQVPLAEDCITPETNSPCVEGHVVALIDVKYCEWFCQCINGTYRPYNCLLNRYYNPEIGFCTLDKKPCLSPAHGPTTTSNPTSEPTEATKATESTPSEPTKATKATESTPSEPTKATKATESTPSEPTKATKATESTPNEPTKATKATESTPSEPTKATKAPSSPTKATKPSPTITPVPNDVPTPATSGYHCSTPGEKVQGKDCKHYLQCDNGIWSTNNECVKGLFCKHYFDPLSKECKSDCNIFNRNCKLN